MRSIEDSPMVRARTKAQRGNSVFQTSMAVTPNPNMTTAKAVSICACRVSLSDRHTEDNEVPPIGDLLVNGHKASVDVRSLAERAKCLGPDLLSVVDYGMRKGSGDSGE